MAESTTIKPPRDFRKTLNGLPQEPVPAPLPHITEIGREQLESQSRESKPKPTDPYDGLIWHTMLDRPTGTQRENVYLPTTWAAVVPGGVMLRLQGSGGTTCTFLPGVALADSKHKPGSKILVPA